MKNNNQIYSWNYPHFLPKLLSIYQTSLSNTLNVLQHPLNCQRCSLLGECMNLANNEAENIISDLVDDRYNKLPTRLQSNETNALSKSSFLLSFSFTTREVGTTFDLSIRNFFKSLHTKEILFKAYFF